MIQMILFINLEKNNQRKDHQLNVQEVEEFRKEKEEVLQQHQNVVVKNRRLLLINKLRMKIYQLFLLNQCKQMMTKLKKQKILKKKFVFKI
jgi:sulfur relay (sulfurtransferase) DsrC/TusE family protein